MCHVMVATRVIVRQCLKCSRSIREGVCECVCVPLFVMVMIIWSCETDLVCVFV